VQTTAPADISGQDAAHQAGSDSGPPSSFSRIRAIYAVDKLNARVWSALARSLGRALDCDCDQARHSAIKDDLERVIANTFDRARMKAAQRAPGRSARGLLHPSRLPYRACFPMNSTMRANMSPVCERSGERPVWRSESM
jgi:hypothetical protein